MNAVEVFPARHPKYRLLSHLNENFTKKGGFLFFQEEIRNLLNQKGA